MDKGQFGRKDRLIQQKRIDAYEEKQKFQEPTLCDMCGAVFIGGRWTWNKLTESDEKIYKSTCPACLRIRDNYPAGYLNISGAFLKTHGEEIQNLIRNVEQNEKKQHPMERIMNITSKGEDNIEITTTGIHIARRIGEAINKAYQGILEFSYGDDEKFIRVKWTRD